MAEVQKMTFLSRSIVIFQTLLKLEENADILLEDVLRKMTIKEAIISKVPCLDAVAWRTVMAVKNLTSVNIPATNNQEKPSTMDLLRKVQMSEFVELMAKSVSCLIFPPTPILCGSTKNTKKNSSTGEIRKQSIKIVWNGD